MYQVVSTTIWLHRTQAFSKIASSRAASLMKTIRIKRILQAANVQCCEKKQVAQLLDLQMNNKLNINSQLETKDQYELPAQGFHGKLARPNAPGVILFLGVQVFSRWYTCKPQQALIHAHCVRSYPGKVLAEQCRRPSRTLTITASCSCSITTANWPTLGIRQCCSAARTCRPQLNPHFLLSTSRLKPDGKASSLAATTGFQLPQHHANRPDLQTVLCDGHSDKRACKAQEGWC